MNMGLLLTSLENSVVLDVCVQEEFCCPGRVCRGRMACSFSVISLLLASTADSLKYHTACYVRRRKCRGQKREERKERDTRTHITHRVIITSMPYYRMLILDKTFVHHWVI